MIIIVIVFDVYVVVAVVRYLEGKYLFDIHPPLGKLTLTAVAWLFGYDPSVCSYDAIHQVYKPECKFVVLRMTAGELG